MDDSVRKKISTAPQLRAVASTRGLETGTSVMRKTSDDAAPRVVGGDHGSVVPLSGGRKSRPKAAAQREKDNTPNGVEGPIGRHLRQVYDDVLNQPIPDRFLDLLTQLETITDDKPKAGLKDESGNR